MSTIIDAIATGLVDGGVKAAYGFPGFSSEKILEKINPNYTISTNERTAYAEAYGSSTAGSRSVVAFKNIGLNIASDAYLHSVISGVNAGLIVCITDDIEVWGSQEHQDSRPLIDYYGGLLFEPDSLQAAYDFSRGAFELSEDLDVPIVIRITNQTLKLKGDFVKNETPIKADFVPRTITPQKFVVHPYYYQQQSANLAKKKIAIQKYVDDNHAKHDDKRYPNGVIKFGLGNNVNQTHKDLDVLSVNTVPAPRHTIENFTRNHSEIIVSESGDGWLYDQIMRIMTPANHFMMQREPPEHTIEFTKWTRYQDLFKVINDIKGDSLIVGDITQFTVESEGVVDVALSMGASVPVAIGIAQSKSFAIAIVGDCSFNHEGLQIVYEAINRGVNMCIIIIDNGVSWCTGAQVNAVPINQINFPDMAYFKKVAYDTGDIELLSEIKNELQKCRKYEGVSIIHIKVPIGSLAR